MVAGETEEGAHLGGAGGIKCEKMVVPAVRAGGEVVRFAGIIDEDVAWPGLVGIASEAVGAATASGPEKFKKPLRRGAFCPSGGGAVVASGAHGKGEAWIRAAAARNTIDKAPLGDGGWRGLALH